MVVSHEQMDTHLRNSNDYFRIRPSEDINAFVLYIRHQARISIVRRIDQDTICDSGRFGMELMEQAGLCNILAEEDPAYRQI